MNRTCAVVGAGSAGLAAARRLQAQGMTVTLFDKGRRPGGRLASRDTAHGVFDHGVRNLAAPGPALRRLLELCPKGHVVDWPACTRAEEAAAPRWIGVPGNNQIAVDWSAGLDVHLGQPVIAVRPDGAGWQVHWAGAQTPFRFDSVIITVPQPQLAALLPDLALPESLERIVYDPCWTLLWVPAADALPAGAALQPAAHATIAQVLREDSKPGRGGDVRYVVHATPAWSREALEQAPETVAAILHTQAAALLGMASGARYAVAHRWRYAEVRHGLQRPQLQLAPGLHYASDGCLGRTVEDAATSGTMAANALLEHLDA